MRKVKLGHTDIEVTRMCIGAWQAAGWASSDDDRFVATVKHALDRGLNFIDTAAAYGSGHSEELVGRAVKGRRDQVVVATKFHAREPGDVRKALEKSLRLLGMDHVDLLQQHWPSAQIGCEAVLDEMEELRREGKIRAIGVSNWMEPEWEEVKDHARVDSLQPCYSLIWRSIEKSVLGLCRRNSISVIPYSPLCQGLLTGRFREQADVPKDSRRGNRRAKPDELPATLKVVDALAEAARKNGKTVAQAALRWLLDQEGITSVIVGASRPEQVDDNLGALDWKLDPADWKSLADLSWPMSEGLKPYDTLWNWHPRLKK